MSTIIERLKQLGVEIPQEATLVPNTGYWGTDPMIPVHSVEVNGEHFINIGEGEDGCLTANVHGESVGIFPPGWTWENEVE